LNQITVQEYAILPNILKLSYDGIEVFTEKRTGVYSLIQSLTWNEDEPTETLRRATEIIGTKSLRDGYDFFLDDDLASVLEIDKRFGSGWEVNLDKQTLALEITSIFAKSTKLLEVRADILDTLQESLQTISITNARIFLRVPTVNFRYCIYIGSSALIKKEYREVNLSMATKLPKFVNDKGCEQQGVPAENTSQVGSSSQKSILSSSKELEKKSCRFVYMLDEKKETELLSCCHILSNTDDPIVIEFGLWCGQFDNRFEKYLTVSDKFEITSEELNDEDIVDFARFVNRMLNVHVNHDTFFIFDTYLSKLLNHDEFEKKLKQIGIEVESVFSLGSSRGFDFSEMTVDWNKHTLISTDEYFHKNPAFPNTHVYSVNINSMPMLAVNNASPNEKLRLMKILRSVKKL
jgi:hypothetical protein